MIVGPRPFTSKANILAAQAIARGLRCTSFDDQSHYVERVDILGNAEFIKSLDQLEKDENLTLETFDPEKPGRHRHGHS